MTDLYFEANKITIGKTYMEPENIYRIPRFQRSYSWEENQIHDFWETIIADQPTFLGTVIYNINNKDVIDIIDGQQRYMTITIFGTVLRDYLWNKRNDDFSEKYRQPIRVFHRKFIGREEDFDQTKKVFYLEPSDSIIDFFKKYIYPLPFENDNNLANASFSKNTPELKIKNAYLVFFNLLDSHLARLGITDYQKIYNEFQRLYKKLSNLFFVRIDIKNDEFAYEIFETVNARGVDLSVSDLIKNQVFKNIIGANSKYLDEAKSKWEDISKNINEVNFSLKEFISYYWTSKHSYVGDKKLYTSIRRELNTNSNGDKWKNFLDDLLYSSEILGLILNGTQSDIMSYFNLEYHESKKIYNSLNVLRNLKAKTWIIAYLTLFRNIKIIQEKIVTREFWHEFEHFAFVYFHIIGAPGNWFFKFISDFSKDIENSIRFDKPEEHYASIFKEMRNEMSSKIPSKTVFIEGFKNIQYKTDSKTKNLIKYIFENIEDKISNGHSEGFDEKVIHIEHILPQDPKKWGLEKKDIKEYVNLIGNLTIISQATNISMSNNTIEDKLEYYSKSVINLTLQLVENINNETWDFYKISKNDFNAIKKRSDFLANIAYSIWIKTEITNNNTF